MEHKVTIGKNSCLDLWQFLLRKPRYLLSAGKNFEIEANAY